MAGKFLDSNTYSENDEFVHTRRFTRDITERKQLQQRSDGGSKPEALSLLARPKPTSTSRLVSGLLPPSDRSSKRLPGFSYLTINKAEVVCEPPPKWKVMG